MIDLSRRSTLMCDNTKSVTARVDVHRWQFVRTQLCKSLCQSGPEGDLRRLFRFSEPHRLILNVPEAQPTKAIVLLLLVIT